MFISSTTKEEALRLAVTKLKEFRANLDDIEAYRSGFGDLVTGWKILEEGNTCEGVPWRRYVRFQIGLWRHIQTKVYVLMDRQFPKLIREMFRRDRLMLKPDDLRSHIAETA